MAWSEQTWPLRDSVFKKQIKQSHVALSASMDLTIPQNTFY